MYLVHYLVRRAGEMDFCIQRAARLAPVSTVVILNGIGKRMIRVHYLHEVEFGSDLNVHPQGVQRRYYCINNHLVSYSTCYNHFMLIVGVGEERRILIGSW